MPINLLTYDALFTKSTMTPTNDENAKPKTNENERPENPNQKLSLINRKFLSGQAFEPPPDRDNFVGFRPQYFFFYGSLMVSISCPLIYHNIYTIY
jgi:hypothetical protein